jgi:hypothetical protein
MHTIYLKHWSKRGAIQLNADIGSQTKLRKQMVAPCTYHSDAEATFLKSARHARNWV